MNILISGFLVMLVVLLINWLSTALPLTANALINLFFWSVIIGLLVGVGVRNKVAWR